MITGMHALICSAHAKEVQDFLSRVLGLKSVDAGEGWPIFAAPPTELAVHPTDEEPTHELYLMCDDVHATIAAFAEKGVGCSPVQDRGWGLVTSVELPGGEHIGMYEPRHSSPLRSSA
jgi:hypothetical protein